MFTQVGACPRCGSPIYSPSVWNGITPPPAQHTCGCTAPQYTTYTTTEIRLEPEPRPFSPRATNG